MFSLKKITKDYGVGNSRVRALKNVSLDFRKSEFVSILGPSGCGKTTLLNIIGGLDQYTTGDLIINGRSTKEYKDRDWDSYRNHSIGFVFQSYNLIPHQTVLQNVEIALTLSGVSKAERRERAKQALREVGLSDQLHKKPSEMSGGQMQRVAIARALVNNPDIILADEPTGALDTETSVQVMEILKSISDKRLIIMVTHNPELAEKYSSRIIRMLDGEVLSDSAPLSEEELLEAEASAKAYLAKQNKKERKPSMSFATSFMLSLKNLFTKKGRTLLTSFAGSIGIIGIALIIAVSQGTTSYINHVQETTLSSYPITLESSTVDLSTLMESFMNVGKNTPTHDLDAVYKDPMIGELVTALSKLEEEKNDLASFKIFLESELQKESSPLKDAVSGIQYAYNLNFAVYTKDPAGNIIKSDSNELMRKMIEDFMLELAANGSIPSMGQNKEGTENNGMSGMMMSSMSNMKMWQELLPGLADENGKRPLVNNLLQEQYDVIYGSWPTSKEEIVLVVNEKNELDDLTLYSLGLLDKAEIDAIIKAAASGKTLEKNDGQKWTYEEICSKTYKTIMPYDCFEDLNNDGIYEDMSTNPLMLEGYYNNAMELRVVGIIRPAEDADTTMLTGAIGYTYELTEHIINSAKNSDVVKAQLANPTVDVLTGLPFKSTTGALDAAAKKDAFVSYVKELNTADKAKTYLAIKSLDAITKNLKAQTDAMLDSFRDKDALIDMIISQVGQEEGMDAAKIREIFANRTLDELKNMIRPSIEQMVTAQITQKTEQRIKTLMTEEQMALALMIEIGNTTSKELLDANQQTRANTYVAIKVLDALNQNLDEQTQNALDVYQDKETLVNMIVGMSGAIPGTDLEALKASLLARELDDLKAMIRPSIEAAITSQIINATKQQIETTLTEEQRAAALTTDVSVYSIEQFVLYYDEITEFSTNDYQSTMTLLGNHELSTPFSINIFASSFENKDVIVDAIATYNSGVDKTHQISYTDYLGIMMSSITTVIDAISYVLIAFVSISLIVSSIMIGVITLISVQERTKEIGILRAIGASKRDVSSMFNAETMIIGFSSGFLGVAVTYLLCIPINAILKAATGLANLRAILPIGAALILIAISVALTLISGLIPSKSAAKKDPVVALRSE